MELQCTCRLSVISTCETKKQKWNVGVWIMTCCMLTRWWLEWTALQSHCISLVPAWWVTAFFCFVTWLWNKNGLEVNGACKFRNTVHTHTHMLNVFKKLVEYQNDRRLFASFSRPKSKRKSRPCKCRHRPSWIHSTHMFLSSQTSSLKHERSALHLIIWRVCNTFPLGVFVWRCFTIHDRTALHTH